MCFFQKEDDFADKVFDSMEIWIEKRSQFFMQLRYQEGLPESWAPSRKDREAFGVAYRISRQMEKANVPVRLEDEYEFFKSYLFQDPSPDCVYAVYVMRYVSKLVVYLWEKTQSFIS